MPVHIQNREGGEVLGSSVLLAAFDDLMLSEYRLDPGTDPGTPMTTPTTPMRST